MVPLEQVLLFFATDDQFPLQTGTFLNSVPATAQCGAVFVDLTDSNTRNLWFDFNNGWSTLPTPGGTWAQNIAPGASIIPLLCQTASTTPSI
jgi:hypothetical protein